MRITKDTKIVCRSIMFGDGANGSYFQKHNLLTEDGTDLEVSIHVHGVKKGRKKEAENTVRYVTKDGARNTTIRKALIAAGHKVEVMK